MDAKARYLFAHNAFVQALWNVDNPPECFETHDMDIVRAHNKHIHDVFAAGQRDFNILFDEHTKMRKEFNLRGDNIENLQRKIKLLNEEIRQLTKKEQST